MSEDKLQGKRSQKFIYDEANVGEGKEQVKAIGSKAKTLFTEKPEVIKERIKTINKGE